MLSQRISDADISPEKDVDPRQIGAIRVGKEHLHKPNIAVSLHIAQIVIPHFDELCRGASILEVNRRINNSRGIGHTVLTNRIEGRGKLEWETRSLQKGSRDPITGKLIAVSLSILRPKNGDYEGVILTETHRRPTDGYSIDLEVVNPFQEDDFQQFEDLLQVDRSDCIEAIH